MEDKSVVLVNVCLGILPIGIRRVQLVGIRTDGRIKGDTLGLWLPVRRQKSLENPPPFGEGKIARGVAKTFKAEKIKLMP